MMWMPSWMLMGLVAFGAGPVEASIHSTDAVENPYRIFVDRNPFGIRPAPPPTNAVVQPKEPPTKVDIKLTGITYFGKRKAYFQLTEAPSGGKQGKVEFISLGVEEKDKGLEVVDIDHANSAVKIRQEGIETVMTFSSHGIAAPASTGMGSVPGGGGIPMPGVNVTAANNLSPNAAANAANAFNATATPVPGAVGGARAGLTTIPSRPVRTTAGMDAGMAARYGLNPGAPAAAPVVRAPETPQHNLSTEEQQLLMELQKVSQPSVVFPPTPGIDFGGAPAAPGGAPGGVPTPLPALPGQR